MRNDDTRWAEALTQATHEKAAAERKLHLALARIDVLERALEEIKRLATGTHGKRCTSIRTLAAAALGGGR